MYIAGKLWVRRNGEHHDSPHTYLSAGKRGWRNGTSEYAVAANAPNTDPSQRRVGNLAERSQGFRCRIASHGTCWLRSARRLPGPAAPPSHRGRAAARRVARPRRVERRTALPGDPSQWWAGGNPRGPAGPSRLRHGSPDGVASKFVRAQLGPARRRCSGGTPGGVPPMASAAERVPCSPEGRSGP